MRDFIRPVLVVDVSIKFKVADPRDRPLLGQ
jgi:hypothetical protein